MVLREWTGRKYTGDSFEVVITYITDYMQTDGYVVLGIREQKKRNVPKEELASEELRKFQEKINSNLKYTEERKLKQYRSKINELVKVGNIENTGVKLFKYVFLFPKKLDWAILLLFGLFFCFFFKDYFILAIFTGLIIFLGILALLNVSIWSLNNRIDFEINKDLTYIKKKYEELYKQFKEKFSTKNNDGGEKWDDQV